MELRDEYMEAGAGRSWNDSTPHHEIPAVVAVDLKINLWVQMLCEHGRGPTDYCQPCGRINAG
jgi:hypothetical protein